MSTSSYPHKLPHTLAENVHQYWQALLHYILRVVSTPHLLFLWLALVVGLICVFVMPPFHGADEADHFFRSYQLSRGAVVAQKQNGQTGGQIPTNAILLTNIVQGDISPEQKGKQTVQDVIRLFAIPLNRSNEAFVDFRNTALFSPIPYVPQAIAIALGRTLNLSPLTLMYAARVLTLVAATLVVYYAIKIIPVAKWVLVLLALTPMLLVKRASLSADALTNSFSMLLIALFLYYAFDAQARLSRKAIIGLIVVAVLVALSKQAYIAIVALYFLIPRQKVGGWVTYLGLFVALVTICTAVSLGWSAVSQQSYTPVEARTTSSTVVEFDTQAQLTFMLTNPLTFTHVVAEHLITLGPAHFAYATGSLGWRTRMPLWFIGLYGLMIVGVALLNHRDSVTLSRWHRLVIGATGVGNVVLIIAAGYLLWNPVGATEVWGIHGRYFTPLAPVFTLLLLNQRFHLKSWQKYLQPLVAFFLMITMVFTVVVLVQSYWG
ncbi:MAG: putative membrane protein [Chloroflexi bacterium AL-N10]|nr:putative membrane protein [Chloroflexi bacterium AL-N1]NOK71100.1 putative membrane protein [Chloroflexi bacterium AL-N10]NOK77348.1 putative membrane protein [Chloroflexi bacterium AL-N5]